MLPFDIKDVDGHKEGSNGKLTGKLLDQTGKMFKRKAIKWNNTDETSVEWLVMSLDGVNVYIQGNDVVVTKENLKP